MKQGTKDQVKVWAIGIAMLVVVIAITYMCLVGCEAVIVSVGRAI